MNNVEIFNDLAHLNVVNIYLEFAIKVLLIIILILGIIYLLKKIKN